MEKIQKIALEKGMVYKPSRSISVPILENKRITTQDSPDDVRHILLDTSGTGMKFYEGQSIGVLAKGVDENKKPHKVRLYSIASSSYGENQKKGILALCVKREILQKEGKTYYGVCSNYLCDCKVSDEITITGPVGRSFLLPADNKITLLMFATGTGIAPYRGFMQKIQQQPKAKGKFFLFMGCKTPKEALYFNQVNNDLTCYSFLNYWLALSRVKKNAKGEKMYIQHKFLEQNQKIGDLLQESNFSIYICGLRNMEKDLEKIFATLAEQKGINWAELKKVWRQSGRWNIETY